MKASVKLTTQKAKHDVIILNKKSCDQLNDINEQLSVCKLEAIESVARWKDKLKYDKMKSKLEVMEQKHQIGILNKNSSKLKLKVDMVEKMCRLNLRELNREHKHEIDNIAGNMKEKSIV